jgi:hypothetical protein
VGTVVLIGLYEWQSEPKNGDVLEVYNVTEVGQLTAIPSTRVHLLEKYMHTAMTSHGGSGGGSGSGSGGGDGSGSHTATNEFVFSHEDSMDDFGSSSKAPSLSKTETKTNVVQEEKNVDFSLEGGGDTDEIDIDDI